MLNPKFCLFKQIEADGDKKKTPVPPKKGESSKEDPPKGRGTPGQKSAAKTGSGENKENGEPRKMWVKVKSTGDLIEIQLDKDRPEHFDTPEQKAQWEMATAKNARNFQKKVPSPFLFSRAFLIIADQFTLNVAS